MKNKYISLTLFLAGVCLITSCRLEKEVEPEYFDFQTAQVQLMDTMAEKIIGRWKLSSVEYKMTYTNPNVSVKKDTIIKDFAMLDIMSVSREESLRYPNVRGKMQFGAKTYPVQFDMLSNAEHLVKRTGPQAFMLFDLAFPPGSSYVWQADELFFRYSGLIGENFSIQFSPDFRTMVWKGLNRDIKEIILERQ